MALDFLSVLVPLGAAGVLAATALSPWGGRLPTDATAVLAVRASEPAVETVITRIKSHVLESHPITDPLVTARDNLRVKVSNRDGVRIDGARYYYRLTQRTSFDPVSRGEARDPVVVTVLYPGTSWEVVIYRLP